MKYALFVLWLAACATAVARAEESAKPLVGDPHEQTLGKAPTLIYTTLETTYETIGQDVAPVIHKLEDVVNSGSVKARGGMMFVYHDADPGNKKPFKLDVGFIVADETQPMGDLKVQKLDAVHCFTILYTGPVTSIGKAYRKVMPSVYFHGKKPTGETREAYLYWEGPDSANNVIQIQVVLK